MSVGSDSSPGFLPSLRSWRLLVRAGGLAIGWPQCGISLVAVAVFWLGLSLLERWSPGEMSDDLTPSLIQFGLQPAAASGPVVAPQWWNPLAALTTPWRSIAEPTRELLFVNRRTMVDSPRPSRRKDLLVVELVFAAVVWSLFGVACCRAVAVQLARERGDPFPQVLRYASSRWLSTVGAPSISAVGILVVLIGLVSAGWFGRLPLVGGPLLTMFSPLLFLAGVALAVLALTIMAGWPLMVAAMSVEECDGFGAFSRAFSFLSGRPLLAIGQAAVSLIYGSLLVAMLGGVFTLALLAEAGPLASIGPAAKWTAVMQGSHFTARWLLMTFAVSLFWSLVTANYLLLRQAVDRKPFHDIAADGDEVVSPQLPVVGIPAADFPQELNTAEQSQPVVTG